MNNIKEDTNNTFMAYNIIDIFDKQLNLLETNNNKNNLFYYSLVSSLDNLSEDEFKSFNVKFEKILRTLKHVEKLKMCRKTLEKLDKRMSDDPDIYDKHIIYITKETYEELDYLYKSETTPDLVKKNGDFYFYNRELIIY